jgi:hypothetical protein
MFLFVEGLPEIWRWSALLGFQFHLLGKSLHRRAQKILNALGNMAPVIQVVLNAQHAVSQNRALSLSAWAMFVDRDSVIFHFSFLNRIE